MRKLIFDSSFLMSVADRPTPWFDDMTDMFGKFEPVILGCVKKELEGISEGEGKKANLARLALQLASKFPVEPCGNAGVDDEIASVALTKGAAVATVDGDLTKSLRALGIDVVGLRSGRVMLR